MKIFILVLLSLAFVTNAGDLGFEDRARSSSFVWKCQTALGGFGVFSNSKPATDSEFAFFLKWLDEDIQKMSQSPEGEKQQQRMMKFRKSLNILLRSDSFSELPEGWKEPKNAEEVAMLLTDKLDEIAQHAKLSLETNVIQKDNHEAN